MKQVLILYASSTGNTEEIAIMLEDILKKENVSIFMKNLESMDMEAVDLTKYDGILFGTYTYDDGNLPFETDIFCDSIQVLDLSGKTIGVFGSGDTSYFQFCGAVDEMKEEFQKRNASVLEHTVKVDLYPDDDEDIDSIQKMAEIFYNSLCIHDIKSS